jgi:hypothetical protein
MSVVKMGSDARYHFEYFNVLIKIMYVYDLSKLGNLNISEIKGGQTLPSCRCFSYHMDCLAGRKRAVCSVTPDLLQIKKMAFPGSRSVWGFRIFLIYLRRNKYIACSFCRVLH